MHLSGRLKKRTWRQSGYSGRKDQIKLSVWGGEEKKLFPLAVEKGE